MAHFLERLTRGRRAPLYAGLAVLMAAVAVVGLARARHGGTGDGATEQSAVARREPFVLTSSFTGRVAPGVRIDLVAPFDARVAQMRFGYGDQVAAGQALIALDPADVGQGRAEAEIAMLRAQVEADRVRHWQQGPEMKRAARAVTAAQDELGDLQAKLSETKVLLDRGLVPRSEYETLLQQQRQRQAAVAAARDEWADTAARGQGGERSIALLQGDVARSQYAQLDAGGAGPVLRAPQAGVIVRPDDGVEALGKAVHTGGRVNRGQVLGVIASTAGLDVAFKLDESDLATVRVGQKAMVTGPGFGGLSLTGVVLGVGGQAEASAGGGKATFEARVRLDPLSEAAGRQVRIGMTADVAIVAHQNPTAITVPPQAVLGAAPQAYVLVRAPGGGAPKRRTVSIGHVGPAAVEVLSGLAPGETVVWEVPKAVSEAAAP